MLHFSWLSALIIGVLAIHVWVWRSSKESGTLGLSQDHGVTAVITIHDTDIDVLEN